MIRDVVKVSENKPKTNWKTGATWGRGGGGWEKVGGLRLRLPWWALPYNANIVACNITPSLSEGLMESLKVVVTFESVDEILWCYHSNETSSAVLFTW